MKLPVITKWLIISYMIFIFVQKCFNMKFFKWWCLFLDILVAFKKAFMSNYALRFWDDNPRIWLWHMCVSVKVALVYVALVSVCGWGRRSFCLRITSVHMGVLCVFFCLIHATSLHLGKKGNFDFDNSNKLRTVLHIRKLVKWCTEK